MLGISVLMVLIRFYKKNEKKLFVNSYILYFKQTYSIMKLTITQFFGKNLTIEIDNFRLVLELKLLISKKLSIPLDNMILIYKDIRLEDGYLLWNYNLNDGSKIMMVLK